MRHCSPSLRLASFLLTISRPPTELFERLGVLRFFNDRVMEPGSETPPRPKPAIRPRAGGRFRSLTSSPICRPRHSPFFLHEGAVEPLHRGGQDIGNR